MVDNTRWHTTQIRVRDDTHEYLKAQAKTAGISVTQVAGALLDHACKEGLTVGTLTVERVMRVRRREGIVQNGNSTVPG
jgi:hypothetical protein